MVAVYRGIGDASGDDDGSTVAISAVEVDTTVGGVTAGWQAIIANAREIKMVDVFTKGIIAVVCIRSKIHPCLLD